MGLAKAILQEISTDTPPEEKGPPIPVQFNPTSLRLAISNTVDTSNARSRQRRQFVGQSPTKLTMQLVFDTADEDGGGGEPRSVRERTAEVEKFITPTQEDDRLSVPKLRFVWGDFIFEGIMDSCSIDIDLFAENGKPLRAKLDVSITEQRRDYEPQPAQSAAPPPSGGNSGNGPGSDGAGKKDRTGIAIGGEAAVSFAARLGLDPAAWRSFSSQFDNPLSLPAGLSIDFKAGASVSLGLGANFGAGSGIGRSSPSRPFDQAKSANADDRRAGGFGLAAAGGTSAAVEQQKIAQSGSAAEHNRQAFAASAPPAPPFPGAGGLGRASAATAPTRPDQVRAPLHGFQPGSPLITNATTPAPPPPVADARATSFGLGVPLRPPFSPPFDRAGVLSGNIALRPKSGGGQVPTTNDPTVPPWVALPASSAARDAADRRQSDRHPRKPCGCTTPCRHVKGGE